MLIQRSIFIKLGVVPHFRLRELIVQGVAIDAAWVLCLVLSSGGFHEREQHESEKYKNQNDKEDLCLALSHEHFGELEILPDDITWLVCRVNMRSVTHKHRMF